MTFRGKPWAPTTPRTCPATLNPPHRPGPPARCQAQRRTPRPPPPRRRHHLRHLDRPHQPTHHLPRRRLMPYRHLLVGRLPLRLLRMPHQQPTQKPRNNNRRSKMSYPCMDPCINVALLRRVRAWSRDTFGPGRRTAGISEHIRRELDEVAAAPHDAHEWVDVIILGIDGALRTGIDPEDLLRAIRAKYSKNEQRQWPDWRTLSEDEAIEHIRQNDTPGGKTPASEATTP